MSKSSRQLLKEARDRLWQRTLRTLSPHTLGTQYEHHEEVPTDGKTIKVTIYGRVFAPGERVGKYRAQRGAGRNGSIVRAYYDEVR